MRAVLVAVAWLAMAHAATAQPPLGGEPTPKRVARIVVTFDDRHQRQGTLLELGPDTLVLLARDGSREEIPLSRVSRLETARDSVKNGVIAGALILGGWCAIICGQGLDRISQLPLAVGANALFGGLIGWGIDAADSSRTLIYQAPSASAPTGRRVALGIGLSW